MVKYFISICRTTQKELEELGTKVVNRVFPKIEALASTSYPRGCIKIQGQDNLWRIRVGDYHVINK